jgi:hypothetical protein
MNLFDGGYPMPDDHIDPDIMNDYLVVHVECGSIYYESHQGFWINDPLLQDMLSAFDEYVSPVLEEFPEVEKVIKESKDGMHTFTVTVCDPEVIIEPGGWTNVGYSFPDYYLGCGEVIVERNI